MSPPGSGPPSRLWTVEQRLVHVLLLAAQTVLRLRRIEPSPTVLREGEAALQTAFAQLWEREARLELEVRPEGIVIDGVVVLATVDDDEGLVAALSEAGIRRLAVDRSSRT